MQDGAMETPQQKSETSKLKFYEAFPSFIKNFRKSFKSQMAVKSFKD